MKCSECAYSAATIMYRADDSVDSESTEPWTRCVILRTRVEPSETCRIPDIRRQCCARALVTRLAHLNIPEDLLDDLVHDAASGAGSAANNAGVAGQVEFLFDQFGETAEVVIEAEVDNHLTASTKGL